MAFEQQSRGAVGFFRHLLREFKASQIPFMAGSIAYGPIVSLLPLIVLVLLAASAVGGEAFRSFVADATTNYLTPVGRDLVVDAITQASGQIGTSIIGVLTLVWGISTVFRNLDVAFSTLYRTTGENGFINRMKDAVVVALGVFVAAFAMFVASVVYAAFPAVPFLPAVNLLALILALAVAFFPIYYVLPDRNLTWKEVVPGTVVAAVGWTVLQGAFQLYVSYSSVSQLYGVLGGVVLLATWLYVGSLALLLGAAVNVVLARRDPTAPGRAPDVTSP